MKGSAEQMTTYAELPTLSVQSEEGLSLAYRDTAGDGRPVLLLSTSGAISTAGIPP